MIKLGLFLSLVVLLSPLGTESVFFLGGGNAIRESVLEVINQMIDLGNQILYVMVIG